MKTRGTQEIPAVSTVKPKAQKVGVLKKLSGKGILTTGTWRDRYCLLVKSKLYFYESEESSGQEKSAGCINLELLDYCGEASTRATRKAENVFVIGSSERSFFDTYSGGRHYFGAESVQDMKEWVNAINFAMNRAKRSSSASAKKSTDMTEKELPTENETLPLSETKLDHVTKSRVRGPQGRRPPRKPGNRTKQPSPPELIDGNFPANDSDEESALKIRGRATSLTALEATSESHGKSSGEIGHKFNGRIQESLSMETLYGPQGIPLPHYDMKNCKITPYPYSSSEDSLVLTNEQIFSHRKPQERNQCSPMLNRFSPVTAMRKEFRAETPVRHSSVTPPPCVLRKFRREQMSNSPRSSFHDNPVNVNATGSKCQYSRNYEDPLKFLNDTAPKRTHSGSSLSTLTADVTVEEQERSMKGSYPRFHQFATFQAARSTRGMSVDKVFPQRTCHYSLQRPSASANASPLLNGKNFGPCEKKMTLEATVQSLKAEMEFVNKTHNRLDKDVLILRKDVGSVQENITVVRGSLDNTREKVTKLQNQVANIEWQINAAIKEAGNMREEAKRILEGAEMAKKAQENLLQETEHLVTWLRQQSAPCSPYNHHGRQIYSPCGKTCCAHEHQNTTVHIMRRKNQNNNSGQDLVDSDGEIELIDESKIITKEKNGGMRGSRSFLGDDSLIKNGRVKKHGAVDEKETNTNGCSGAHVNKNGNGIPKITSL